MKAIKALLLASVFTASAAAAGCSDTKNVSSPSESGISDQAVSPESISFEWQDSYESKLEEFKSSDAFSEDSAFDLTDLTGDGNPELIISQGTEKQSVCEIYTYSGGTFSELGTAGFEGTFDYLPEFGLTREEYHGDGFLLGKLRQYDNGEFVDFLTYSDNSDLASSGVTIVHEINGEEMLLPDYEAALAQYIDTLTMHIGRKYSFGDDSVNYAVHCAQSWGAVLGTDRKSLCREKLSGIMEDMGEDSKDAAFELCDLNGDDVPEIIVSYSSAPDSACSVYYFSGPEIEQLDGEYGRYGRLMFDISNLVFYSETESGMTCWSLADSSFSADTYKPSDSIMEAGRRFTLDESGIDASLV